MTELVCFQKKVKTRLEGEPKKSENSRPEPEMEDGSDGSDGSDQRFVLARQKAKGEKPKEVRSLTGEIIDEKRMAELRKIK